MLTLLLAFTHNRLYREGILGSWGSVRVCSRTKVWLWKCWPPFLLVYFFELYLFIRWKELLPCCSVAPGRVGGLFGGISEKPQGPFSPSTLDWIATRQSRMSADRGRRCQVRFGPSALEAGSGGLPVTAGAWPATSVIAQIQGTFRNSAKICRPWPEMQRLWWTEKAMGDGLEAPTHGRRVESRPGRYVGLGMRHALFNGSRLPGSGNSSS